MNIANPIYDVVFKYLMADGKIAKLLIGSIIEQEIIELEFSPQEHTIPAIKGNWTVYRVDFLATIKTTNGFKKVLIEIQKAKFDTDIMRFRKYLGAQYGNKENSYQSQSSSRTVVKALPIVSIYFLGYPIEHINAPVIKVKRHYYDVIDNNQEIKQKAEFIESLTHDSFVIQIPHLRKKFRNELECLLSVFDQHNKTADDHFLTIQEQDYPEKYRMIIRRLLAAGAEPEVRETMDIEDEIFEELENKERELAKKDEKINKQEKALGEQDKVLNEQKKVLDEQKQALGEHKKALSEKDKALDEKEKAIEAKEQMIKKLMEKLKQSE